MMTCLLGAILGGVIASLLYELVFPPVARRLAQGRGELDHDSNE